MGGGMTDARESHGGAWMAAGLDVAQALVWLPTTRGTMGRPILDAAGIGAGTRVLELGCGTGSVTAEMVRRGAVVTGVDFSPDMLRRARGRAPTAEFVQANILEFAAEPVF